MKLPPLIVKLLSDYFRWLAGGIVLIILIAGYFLVVAAKIQTIQTAGFLQRNAVRAELAGQRQYLAALDQAIARFESVLPPDKLRAVDEFIPSDPDFPGLLLTLQNLASAANLNLDSVSISPVGQLAATGPTASADQVAAAPSAAAQAATASGVNLQVQDAAVVVRDGQSYESFKNFIALIESSQRLFDIVSLSFDFGNALAGQTRVSNYSLHLRTYYLPSSNQ